MEIDWLGIAMVDCLIPGDLNLGHRGITEVQLLSFVCSTLGKGSKPRLWNIQNLGAVRAPLKNQSWKLELLANI